MTRVLLVVPTGHGVGLTSTCLGLIGALRDRGVDVGFYKPLAQPGTEHAPTDRSTALVRLVSPLEPPEPVPAEVVEKSLSQNDLDTLLEGVVATAAQVADDHDVLGRHPS